MPSTSCPSSESKRTSYAVPAPGTRIFRRFLSWIQVRSRAGAAPASQGVTPLRKRVSQKSGRELSCGKQRDRSEHRGDQHGQEPVAPCVLPGDAVERGLQRAEPVLGE